MTGTGTDSLWWGKWQCILYPVLGSSLRPVVALTLGIMVRNHWQMSGRAARVSRPARPFGGLKHHLLGGLQSSVQIIVPAGRPDIFGDELLVRLDGKYTFLVNAAQLGIADAEAN